MIVTILEQVHSSGIGITRDALEASIAVYIQRLRQTGLVEVGFNKLNLQISEVFRKPYYIYSMANRI